MNQKLKFSGCKSLRLPKLNRVVQTVDEHIGVNFDFYRRRNKIYVEKTLTFNVKRSKRL